LQVEELRGKQVSIIADSTPRMGDVFAMTTRFVTVKNNKATADQGLVHVDFIRGYLNAATQCSAVRKGLDSVRLINDDVTSASMDGCSTNKFFIKMILNDQDAEWMLNRYFSHYANNAGNKAGFPTLDQFWALLQKIFTQSEGAHVVFEQVT
jgi:hypothetical protein